MLNRLVAADCNLDLMWKLDQDRGARNSGRTKRRVLKGKGRREGGSSWDIRNKWGSGTTNKKTEGRRARTHRWQTQMGTKGQRHSVGTVSGE